MLFGLCVLGSQSVRAEERSEGIGGVYLGVDYFTGIAGSDLHDFLYIIPGIVVDEPTWHLDVRSFAFIGIPDAILGAFTYLATGDAEIPLWNALNNGDENPGCLRMMETEFRYALKQRDGHKLDLGGLFDVWWMSPAVRGDHFGNILWNLGASAGWGYQNGQFASNLTLQVGNGFSDTGGFNPFWGAEAFVRVKLFTYFGLYARVLTRLQNYDFSGYDSNDPMLPSEAYDFRTWELTISADAGIVLLVF